MIFSNFTKTESGNIVYLKNSTPVLHVNSINFYTDNSTGSFSKKEFRWSFDKNYWSSWENLTQGNFTNIILNKDYIFFEIRYYKINSKSLISKFSIDYNENNDDISFPLQLNC